MSFPAIAKVFGTGLVLISVVGRLQGARSQTSIGVSKLAHVLYCLNTQQPDGYKPPHFRTHAYRLRYVYGKFSEGDEDDELHMLVYGPREKTATFYEVYLEAENGSPEIDVATQTTTFKKQQGRLLVVGDIPGGYQDYRRIRRLLVVIARRPAIRIVDGVVRPGPESCPPWR